MRHQYRRDRAISNHHKRRFLAVAGVARPYLSENHGYRVLLRVLTKDECRGDEGGNEKPHQYEDRCESQNTSRPSAGFWKGLSDSG